MLIVVGRCSMVKWDISVTGRIAAFVEEGIAKALLDACMSLVE
jgi:hypothetical protein